MSNSNIYSGFRHPPEIISHAVWMYFRFTLSFRDVEEMLASRSIIVTYETVRQWTLRFGQDFANTVRRKQSQRGDKWFLDGVVLTIKGRHHYLWRAVDQDGFTLDILMQSRRNRHAAKRFFRKLMNNLRYAPRVIITDKIKSYAAAKSNGSADQFPNSIRRSDLHQFWSTLQLRMPSPGILHRCRRCDGCIGTDPLATLYGQRLHRIAGMANRRPASIRLARPNKVNICAMFFASPR